MTPVISTDLALALARAVVGLVVVAHGAQKVFGAWGGPGITGWTQAMTRMGMRPAKPWAYLTSLVELAGGIALAVGFLIPIVAAVMTMQLVVAIQRAHWAKGFFNSKGGIEFTLTLASITALNGVAGPGTYSVDSALGLPVFGAGAYLAALVIAALVYFASSRPPKTEPAKVSQAA
jgi:putative oxidoreductase